MNIVIIANEPFPVGMAATNRILSLAKGFVELNARVKVVPIRPSEDPKSGVANEQAKGNYNGIDYEYSCGTTIRSSMFLMRRWLVLKGMLGTIPILQEAKRKGQDVVLLLYSNSVSNILFFYIVSKLLGLFYVIDKSEYPFVLRRQSLIGRIYAKLYTSTMYKLFDVIFVMTSPLEAYFRTRVRKNAKLLLVPMTVEMSRFLIGPLSHPDGSPYIAYCGYLGDNKDGVQILVKAFSILTRKQRDIKLFIIGEGTLPSDLQQLKDLAFSLGLSEKIVFTGRVSRDEMPRYLCNASALALARPRSLQSEGGFPTKLGEYLSTGNPVVVTRVGDIPVFLRDEYDAFLVEPDSAEAFAERLDYVLSNPELAKRVGLNGRTTALNNFDYRIQSKRVIDFLHELGVR